MPPPEKAKEGDVPEQMQKALAGKGSVSWTAALSCGKAYSSHPLAFPPPTHAHPFLLINGLVVSCPSAGKGAVWVII